MSNELKPCPKCGNARAVLDYDAHSWRVECDCPVFDEYNSEENAIRGWNQRPSDAVLESARNFLTKVDEVGKHVDAVIGVQAARGYPYNGPNWKEERDALAALLPSESASDPKGEK